MPEKKQRGRLGRGLAIAVYSVALGYLVIVGFASVIPQVFWPESDDSFDLECADGGIVDSDRSGDFESDQVGQPGTSQVQVEVRLGTGKD